MTKEMANSLERRALAFIQGHNLLPVGEGVLVGVSGGPDSVCLLHLLASLQRELAIELHVAHLNHGLRTEAVVEAQYVAQLAQGLGLPLVMETRDVAGYHKSHPRLSPEESARQVRYAFFQEMCQKVGAGRVAVGHTADDQVESILLHLVQGSGLRGLTGMAPVSRWRGMTVVRPLLEVRRKDTEAYCQARGLSPRQDASNLSPAYLRNRLRQELLPLLESLNPGVRQALLRLSRSLAQDLAYLEGQVSLVWGGIVSEENGGLSLDRPGLSHLPPALQRHLLLRAWGELRGNPQDLEAVHLEKMLAALSGPAGKRLSLPRGIQFWVDYGQVRLGREPHCPFPTLEGEYSLVVPGETIVSGWRVRASLLPAPAPIPEDSFVAHLDFSACGGKLLVRTRRQGDRIQPLGMAGEKSLQDFLVDAKIPQYWRDCLPLVVAPRGIAWVVGYRIAHWARIKEETREILRLEFCR